MLRRRVRGIVLISINTLMRGNRLWRIKRLLLRSVGVEVGANTKIVGPIKMGVCSSLRIGENCWIGSNMNIQGNAGVIIGDNCDLAPDVCFATGTHEIGSHNRRAGKGYCNPIVIEDGCWIGIKSILLAGVTVKSGSIIAAGALVNREVEEDSLVGGVPAKVIKHLK